MYTHMLSDLIPKYMKCTGLQFLTASMIQIYTTKKRIMNKQKIHTIPDQLVELQTVLFADHRTQNSRPEILVTQRHHAIYCT